MIQQGTSCILLKSQQLARNTAYYKINRLEENLRNVSTWVADNSLQHCQFNVNIGPWRTEPALKNITKHIYLL